jgi:signal transduction histidine kinase
MNSAGSPQQPQTSARSRLQDSGHHPGRQGHLYAWLRHGCAWIRSRLATVRRSRHTVRLRLTLLYTGLFLASSAGLLAITYVLVALSITGPVKIPPGGSHPDTPDLGTQSQAAPSFSQLLQRQAASDLHQLLVQSGVALGIMAVVAVVLGWVFAGRVLQPLRAMTATTREISEQNLHNRLALRGPPDELKELGDTIDGLLGRLEAAFDAERRFVANVSHELRTPLTMLRTSLDVAVSKPGPLPVEVQVLAGKLREGLDQADRLVESFLMLARTQQGALGDGTSVSLPQIVSAALVARGEAMSRMGVTGRKTLEAANVVGSKILLAR